MEHKRSLLAIPLLAMMLMAVAVPLVNAWESYHFVTDGEIGLWTSNPSNSGWTKYDDGHCEWWTGWFTSNNGIAQAGNYGIGGATSVAVCVTDSGSNPSSKYNWITWTWDYPLYIERIAYFNYDSQWHEYEVPVVQGCKANGFYISVKYAATTLWWNGYGGFNSIEYILYG